jgi:multidrug efflux pump subunit AcrB
MSASEVERKVTTRLEKLLYQIDGVEYIYSMSRPGQCIVTVRFYVGEDREDSLVKLYNKIQSNVDQVPPAVTGWVVKPVEVDDVPIVNVTLWSDTYDDYALRRLAEQIQNELQAIRNTNRVWVIAGRPRQIRVELDPVRLAARRTSALQVAQALQVSNVQLRAGQFEQQDREIVVEAGTFVRDAQDLQGLVVQLSGNRPVHLRDVADVLDDPAEADSYSWIGFGPAAQNPHSPTDQPALADPPPAEDCIRQCTLPWPSRRAAMPSGWPTPCTTAWASFPVRGRPIASCRTASTTASPATTAKPPTRRSTNWWRV